MQTLLVRVGTLIQKRDLHLLKLSPNSELSALLSLPIYLSKQCSHQEEVLAFYFIKSILLNHFQRPYFSLYQGRRGTIGGTETITHDMRRSRVHSTNIRPNLNYDTPFVKDHEIIRPQLTASIQVLLVVPQTHQVWCGCGDGSLSILSTRVCPIKLFF